MLGSGGMKSDRHFGSESGTEWDTWDAHRLNARLETHRQHKRRRSVWQHLASVLLLSLCLWLWVEPHAEHPASDMIKLFSLKKDGQRSDGRSGQGAGRQSAAHLRINKGKSLTDCRPVTDWSAGTDSGLWPDLCFSCYRHTGTHSSENVRNRHPGSRRSTQFQNCDYTRWGLFLLSCFCLWIATQLSDCNDRVSTKMAGSRSVSKWIQTTHTKRQKWSVKRKSTIRTSIWKETSAWTSCVKIGNQSSQSTPSFMDCSTCSWNPIRKILWTKKLQKFYKRIGVNSSWMWRKRWPAGWSATNAMTGVSDKRCILFLRSSDPNKTPVVIPSFHLHCLKQMPF